MTPTPNLFPDQIQRKTSIDIPNEDTLENIRGSDFIEAVDTNIATEINKSV